MYSKENMFLLRKVSLPATTHRECFIYLNIFDIFELSIAHSSLMRTNSEAKVYSFRSQSKILKISLRVHKKKVSSKKKHCLKTKHFFSKRNLNFEISLEKYFFRRIHFSRKIVFWQEIFHSNSWQIRRSFSTLTPLISPLLFSLSQNQNN